MEFKLEESVNHRIATLAGLLKRQVYRIIAENKLDITPEQWVIMYYLWQQNGLSIGELANRTYKDFANVTRIVDKLEKLGYVNKVRNIGDSRSTNVFILPKADEIKQQIQNCQRESTDIALKGISEIDQKKILSIIEKMEKNILENLK